MNLYELAQEYNELVWQRDAVTEGDWDEEDFDRERYEELLKLNEQLEGKLDYPKECSVMIVEDDDKGIEGFAMQWAEDLGYIDDGSPLYHYIDWKELGDSIISDSTTLHVEFEGSSYYVFD